MALVRSDWLQKGREVTIYTRGGHVFEGKVERLGTGEVEVFCPAQPWIHGPGARKPPSGRTSIKTIEIVAVARAEETASE